MQRTQIDIPTLVRIKAGAAGRVGIYARRNKFRDVVILHSSGLEENLMQRFREGLEILWLSGVGDLVAKLTAITDWKLAFHAVGTKINDFAALLSDSTVFQFIARPLRDLEGVRLLGTALMLNGISMGVCGSSRPASGSEHLMRNDPSLKSCFVD